MSDSKEVEIGTIESSDQAEPKKSAWQKYKESNEEKDDSKADKSDKNGESGFLRNYFRILKIGDKWDFLMMFACLVTSIGAGIAVPLMFVVLGQLVGNFATYFTPGTNLTEDEFMHQVRENSLRMVAIGAARFGLDYISLFSVRMSGLRISARLRLAYLTALFKQPVSFIDRTSPGKIASRLTANANTIQLGISQQFAIAVQSLALTIGLYVTSFIKAPLLTLVASSSLPAILIVYSLSVPFIYKSQKSADAVKELASGLAFEVFNSIRIVTAFSAQKRLESKHSEFIDNARKIEKKNAPVIGLMMAPMFFSMYASFALTFWFGIRQLSRGNFDGVGDIVVVLFSINMAVTGLGRIVGPVLGMIQAASSASEIFMTIDSPVPDMSGLKAPDVSPNEHVEFKNVCFAYPSRKDIQVLNNLCVKFEKGKTTAIVGPSGSGKSTIVGLLQRWYEPTPLEMTSQGSEDTKSVTSLIGTDVSSTNETGIFVGTTPLSKIDAHWWRKQIGLVQQEPFLFNDSIYNNIANGLTATQWADVSKDEKMILVKKACEEAYADEFISKLPLGYETVVGESGIKISGGQRQRLAIARAIIKQPTILILDEATSAIDVRSEGIVQKALDRVSENRTTITIAHRLSTIKRADKIVVLRAGEIVEQGIHSKLLEDPTGVYYGLVKAQNLVTGSEEASHSEPKDEEEQIIDAEILSKTQTGQKIDELIAYKERGVLASFGLLMYEQRFRWVLYSIILVTCAVNGATYPVSAYIFARLINVFTLIGSSLVERGNFWSLMLFVVAIATGAAYFVMGWAGSIIAAGVSAVYRKEYFTNLLRKRIEFFDSEGMSPGTLTSHLATNSKQLQELLGNHMGMSLISIFNLLGSVIISFYFGWKLALVGVLAIMPVVLVAGYLRISLESGFQKLNAAVFEESSQFASEATSAYRTVTSLLLETKILDRFSSLVDHHASVAWRRARFTTIVFAFSDTAEIFCQALCFYYGGTLLAKREYDIVTYFVIYMSAIQAAQAAGMWFSFAPNIVEATAAANRILSIRPTAKDLASPAPPPMPPGTGPASIEFRNVSFHYKDRAGVPVLNRLNLRVEPGQFAALVGASGAGKSTVISLLERFYDPTAGSILVDGVDIASVDPQSYRAALALVAQESTLYEGSVADNIALSVLSEDDLPTTTTTTTTTPTSNPSSTPHSQPPTRLSQAMQTATRAAQIHAFITSLPAGYDTLVGPRGIELSGGQRQRIALARALLRAPRVLLLDEATSNLDSESEAAVQRAIEGVAAGGGGGDDDDAAGGGGGGGGESGTRRRGRMTVLAVAHRLATVQKADVIFVVGRGEVLEQGTHQELIAKEGGIYREMVLAQALDR